jgi:hypothetical protein
LGTNLLVLGCGDMAIKLKVWRIVHHTCHKKHKRLVCVGLIPQLDYKARRQQDVEALSWQVDRQSNTNFSQQAS